MFLRALFSIPIFPLGRTSGRGIFVNRRNPQSHWISPNDVKLNVVDWFYAFANRTPPDAFVRRDEDNAYRGSSYSRGPTRNGTSARRQINPFGY